MSSKNRPVHRPILCATALCLAAVTALAEQEDEEMAHRHLEPDVARMVERLEEGGHVLVIRHERTDALRPDDEEFRIGDCATQRNLSVAGTANAIENGSVIRYLDIPVGDVFASPMCRTLDTGRLMFGSVEAAPALFGYEQDPDEVRAAFEELVVSGANQETNTALVTHLGTYAFVFGGHLAEGDTAVFAVQEGTPRRLGIIAANAWNDAVIDATIRERARSGGTHGHD